MSWRSLISATVWFGIITGLVEGIGLLFFQRLNWPAWGRMVHVAEEVLWISPTVDLIFFVLIASLIFAVARVLPKVKADDVVAFCLTFLAIYDWLTLTGRLYHRACFLLALGVAAVFVRWYRKHREAVLQFWRRTVWLAIAAFALVLLAIEGGKWMHERWAVAKLPTANSASPNVLVIVVDTLRADHVSAYGYQRPTTPNIDQLASQGVLFENAIAPCSWTLPSHVSLLTGRYEHEHGVGNVKPAAWSGHGNDRFGGYPTLGEVLEQNGYRTAAFSANRGFFSRSLGFDRGFLHFEDYFHSPADSFLRTLYGKEFARLYLNRSEKSKVKRALRFLGMNSLLDKDAEGSAPYGGAQAVRKRASSINEEVLDWIDKDRGHPFFVFINYYDVHSPYGPPQGYPRPSWDHGESIDEYDASVLYVDDYIGRLRRGLEQRGRLQNTIVIVTSDHGESLGQHGLLYHAQALYWELIHVPLVVWYPGHVPEGLRVSTPVSNVAMPATVSDLVNTRGERVFPGPPLGRLWELPQAGGSWPAPLSELTRNEIIDKADREAGKSVPTAIDGSMKSLVTPHWHFITHEARGDQLYHWETDPTELADLAKTSAGEATAAPLKSELRRLTAAPAKKQ